MVAAYKAHSSQMSRNEAVTRYGPMVRRVASQLMARLPANVDIDDLVQAGMLGLFDALGRYEVDQGAQFETFAMQRVRGAMLDELRSTDWMPRSVRKAQRTIEQAVQRTEQKLRRSASESEVASELGMSLPQYHALLNEARGAQLMYLDDMTHDADADDFLERHVPENDEQPLETLGNQRFREALAKSIGELPEREQLVMSLYYEQDLNLKEIGAVLGVTESRVSQLHSQAVARLRSRLKDWVK
jgi:RNA polymerase sigma factor for flagellar operon FliA